MWGAAAWVGTGAVLAALLIAVSPLPASFGASAEHPVAVPTPGPLGSLWDGSLLLLPVGERGVRGELGVMLQILAVAAAAGLLAFRLYRGTGRGAAALATAPVCAALLLGWSRAGAVHEVAGPDGLGFTLLATLGLAAFVGARVRGRGSAAAMWLRGGGRRWRPPCCGRGSGRCGRGSCSRTRRGPEAGRVRVVGRWCWGSWRSR
jgi:hypothetical protein